MAKLLEYQGKEILQRFGISTPRGRVVRTASEAQSAADEIGYPVVLKAQIYSGKRGKANGIRIVHDRQDLTVEAAEMLSCPIRGLPVSALLVEEKIDVQGEIYAGVTSDPSKRTPIIIACLEGGVEIEETAHRNPAALLKLNVDILKGVYLHDTLNLLRNVAAMSSSQKLCVAQIMGSLYEIYRRHDCTLVEINPLALTEDGVKALDARVEIDDDAIGRQAGLNLEATEQAGERSATQLEHIAGSIDEHDHRGTVHFVQIDPDLAYVREHGMVPIGFDCVGAGASLSMMDELVPLGFYPVNFCDSSGNPVGSKLYRITKVIFSQPGIQGYVFVSCISSQQLDNTARGIIKALKELYPHTRGQPNIPAVLAFRGAWDREAIDLLRDSGVADGRWVRVLGREATENSIAESFRALYDEWKNDTGSRV